MIAFKINPIREFGLSGHISNLLRSRRARTALIFAICISLITNSTSLGAQNQNSPLIDPGLRIGTLPNGMKYYVKSNSRPAKRAMLWLAVDVGSLHEDDDQLGYAHFLEHMAFNGTRHFPGNSLIEFVEQSGMTFGADLNASTSFDETIYKLTVPTDDPKIFANGLQIIEDWANGGILNDNQEIINERGVVMGEWRMRKPDSASLRFQTDMFKRLLGDSSRYIERMPIGTPQSLEIATAPPMVRFYNDWYRPDLMAIIAVGDFDAATMEKEIKRRFGSIPESENKRPFERPAVRRSVGTTVQIVHDRVRPQIDITWPAEISSSSAEERVRYSLMEQLIMSDVQDRINRLAKSERRPFAGAVFRKGSSFARPIGNQYTIQLVATPDSLIHGLKTVMSLLESVARYGIDEVSLSRSKDALLRRYQLVNDGSSAVSSTVFVESYVQHFLKGQGSLLSSSQAYDFAAKILPTITSADLSKHAQSWRNPDRRVVEVRLPKTVGVRKLDSMEVIDALNSVLTSEIAAPDVKESTSLSASFPFTPTGNGQIINEEQIKAVNVTRWNLSNGARVVFKQTGNNPDLLTINAWSMGGHTQLSDADFFSSGRLVGMLMSSSGGLGGKSREELSHSLATTGVRQVSVDINAFNESIQVSGSPLELEALFQVAYGQFTNPTIDTNELAEWRRTGGASLKIDPNDRIALQMSGGNRRLAPPQPVQVAFMDIKRAMKIYNDRFGDASDFTFYIVGAASVEEVKPLIEKYIATLPSTNRSERETLKDLKIPMEQRKVTGRNRSPRLAAEQAQLQIMFKGLIPETSIEYLNERRRLTAVSRILGTRLRNKLREEMAVTYSAGAPAQTYSTPDERYVMSISLLTAPDVMDESVAAIWKIIDEFRNTGPTDSELESALIIEQRQRENAYQSDGWWIRQFQHYDQLGIPYDYLADNKLAKLTKTEVQAAAQKYLSKEFYTQIVMLPTEEVLKKAKEEKTK